MATVILPQATINIKRIMSNVTIIRPAKEDKKELLIAAFKKNNIRYEVHQGKLDCSTLIGFQFKGKSSAWVWHWVEYLVLDITGYTCLSFDHSYSMNTGKSKKSFSQQYSIQHRLHKETGFDNWY